MAHHARVEEISDSEPEEMDPSDFDPQAFARSMMGAPGPSGLDPQLQPQSPFAGANNPNAAAQRAAQAEMQEKSKNWQCIYPVYFDASRTRAEGRRVSKELAVPSPLAREMVDAVAALGLTQVVFEPGKTHPKDWSNPGRVRVLIKKEGGVPVHPKVQNSKFSVIIVLPILLDSAVALHAHPRTWD